MSVFTARRFFPWAVLTCGALVFPFAFPNSWIPQGWGVLGWIALIPLFFFTKSVSWLPAIGGGALWSFVALWATLSWLGTFHALALPIVLFILVPQYAILFGVSSIVWKLFPVRGHWIQPFLWTAFEYLRTLGFLGFPYADIASTQAFFPWVIQSADILGTSGVTFLIAAVAAFAANWNPKRKFFANEAMLLGIVAGFLWIPGSFRMVNFQNSIVFESWKPALIQHVQDPWKGGADAYRSGFEKLVELSDLALAEKPDAVVWSETAFVPSVHYHTKYRDTPESYRLVRDLEEYLAKQTVPFVVGNDHREKTPEGKRVDYNAALVWDRGWSEPYKKRHLVPFTESFPYKDALPWIYDWLEAADTHFWEPGTEAKVFRVGPVDVATPICFEDVFASDCREFVAAGADVLVNLTNDSWSGSVAAMRQHLAHSIYRAVENRRSVVRASNDGSTAAIGPDGAVIAALEERKPGSLVVEVPVVRDVTTFYTQWGDVFSWLCLAVVGVSISASIVLTTLRRRKK